MSFFSLGDVWGASPGDPGHAWFETPAVTFDGPNAAFVTESDNVAHNSIVYAHSVGDIAAAPAGDATAFEALAPGETATFSFGSQTPMIHTISLYIGSVDSYNLISILGAGGVVEGTISGSDIAAQAMWGNRGAWATNRRLYISDLPADFSGIEFSSSGIAFEYDDIAMSSASFAPRFPTYIGLPAYTLPASPMADPAPEPAMWTLMLLGCGLAGARTRYALRSAKVG